MLKEGGGAFYFKRLKDDCTYPMGTDPIWGIAQNKLTYINGVKMKLSVIFGVLHMTMGILHKGTNCVYFRDWASLFTEVVTGLIILLGLFGWMDLLIIAKWLTPLDIDDNTPSTDRVRCPGTSAGLETNGDGEDLRVPTTGDC
jgi:vacuolar-type H+-ATPase subunit I/STV1